MTNSINSIQLSPMLQAMLKNKTTQQPSLNKEQNKQSTTLTVFSPLLIQTLLAQKKQILPSAMLNIKDIEPLSETPASKRVQGYKNDLRSMMLQNKAQILGVIPRTMNAKDTDGNELIQGDEEAGNFINAVERLDEIKDTGFNTLHVLPIHEPGKTNAMGTEVLYIPQKTS